METKKKRVTFSDEIDNGMEDSLLRRIQWIPEDERIERDRQNINCCRLTIAILSIEIAGCIIYATSCIWR